MYKYNILLISQDGSLSVCFVVCYTCREVTILSTKSCIYDKYLILCLLSCQLQFLFQLSKSDPGLPLTHRDLPTQEAAMFQERQWTTSVCITYCHSVVSQTKSACKTYIFAIEELSDLSDCRCSAEARFLLLRQQKKEQKG